MLIYNGQIIAGGGTIVLPMTRAEYEANKAILDSADVWVDLTDEPDDIATADQVAFWVGQTQKSVGYIGDIATKAIAKVEPTDTALYLHEVGTYFINKDGNACKVDLQIPINGTITLGTNCHVVDGGISSDLSHVIENQWDTQYNIPTTCNSFANAYEFPTHGVILCIANNVSNAYLDAQLSNGDGTNSRELVVANVVNGKYQMMTVPVFKGMKVFYTNINNGGFITFMPYVY